MLGAQHTQLHKKLNNNCNIQGIYLQHDEANEGEHGENNHDSKAGAEN